MKTKQTFSIENIFDKNINFLIGSGASQPYIPTLSLPVNTSYEDLLTRHADLTTRAFILFNYYSIVIIGSFCCNPLPQNEDESNKFAATSNNYKKFINNLIPLLERRQRNINHRANIFTTNYDLFFEKTADSLHKNHSFILNDGALGHITRNLSISNFHLSTAHQGTHDNYRYEIPTINLIKMHGSISWQKEDEDTINVIYPETTIAAIANLCKQFPKITASLFEKWNSTSNFSIPSDNFCTFTNEQVTFLSQFMEEYKKIAIVNPTKEKFYETVFQQHYYQSLRLLSYELEKPQAVLICFGFSFRDEHIKDIILRSLTNKQLQVYAFCHSPESYLNLPETIKNAKNVECIFPIQDEETGTVTNIDFDEFTQRLFKRQD